MIELIVEKRWVMRYCSLSSGSKGNSAIFSAKGTHIMIDAGISTKRLAEGVSAFGLTPNDIAGILITHEHSDHVSGLRVFSEKYRIPVYMNEKTSNAAESLGLDMRLVRIFRTNEDFYIRDLCINAVPISHDAAEPVGYCIECGGRKVSFFTDLGHMPASIINAAMGSELVVLEANHDVEMLKNGRYPYYLKKRILGKRGHLSNDECASAAVELVTGGVSRIVLAHMSDENNRPELARDTVCASFREAGIKEGRDVLLGLSLQCVISPIYEMG